MLKTWYVLLTWTAMLAAIAGARAAEVEIDSLAELEHWAHQSGNTVVMQPGEYKLIDHLSLEEIGRRRGEDDFAMLRFSGSDNTFRLVGVTIEVDTRLRAAGNPPVHTSELIVSGNDNTIEGLTVTNIGEGTSPGGAVMEVAGDRNTLQDCTLRVQGSWPYGYGDLFGKGGGRKQSGMLVLGRENRILGCRLFLRAFGHGFYIQKNAADNHFEDCYVEGEMRPTDEMLAETSGYGAEREFRSVYRNRQGEERVTPGYMKSLCEDGFRTYHEVQNTTFINCTAKNTRAGFELRTPNGVRVEGCTTIGTERGYWVGTGAVVRDCRGDAKYGPLLFLEGRGAEVELTLVPTESEWKVHSLATIHGSEHEVTLRAADQEQRNRPVPILVGYSQPGAGEAMSPYSERPARNITLRNETTMPLQVGEQAERCTLLTAGPVEQNAGRQVTIRGVRP